MALYFWILALVCISAGQDINTEPETSPIEVPTNLADDETLIATNDPSTAEATEATDAPILPPEPAAPSEDAKAAIQISKKSIETAHKVLDLYNDVDLQLPWSKFKGSLHDFDEYTGFYSEIGASMVGRVKTYLMNAIDAHFEASRHISEWCSLIIPLLKTHFVLFTGHTASKVSAQNRLMQKILADGVHRTELAQLEIGLISSNLNEANETLTKLFKQFEIDYVPGSAFFKAKLYHIKCEIPRGLGDMMGARDKKALAELTTKLAIVSKFFINLRGLVDDAFLQITKIEDDSEDQIMLFEELLHESENLKDFEPLEIDPELNSSIVKNTQELIAKSAAYVQKHRDTGL